MARARSKLAVEAPAQLEPGAVVDRFRVERVLWVAADGSILAQALTPGGARVALKLLGRTASDPEQQRQAIQMARTRAALDHPHLVPLLEVGEHYGRLYLVSELRGTTRLADRLGQGALETADAVRVVAGAAGALEIAAGEGLLHSELTPQSILLADEEPAHALLTDFGIGRERAIPQRLRIDVEGTDYRSPEEIKGAPLAPESNAYSLACVLFECLTGSPPYPYERPLLTLHAHLVEPPPRPCELKSDLPSELDEVFARAMAKEPGQRLGSVALARAAGHALGVEVAIPAGAERPAEKRRARRPRRAGAPTPTTPARAPVRPRPVAPARAKRARSAQPDRAAKPAPAVKPVPAAKPAAAAKPARAAHPAGARPTGARRTAQRRRGSRRLRPSIALVAVALLVSAISGFSLGRSDPAPKPPSAPRVQPKDNSAKMAQAEYARSVSPAVDRLSARRAEARRRLRRARRPGRQAEAARALVKAYAEARRAISAEPATSAEQAGLLAQLSSAERAYRRLAVAARNENERAWRSASRAAVEHERRFERSLVTLTSA